MTVTGKGVVGKVSRNIMKWLKKGNFSVIEVEKTGIGTM
jgi:hypothetical protein